MEITENLAELIGIIIGDGNIHYNKKTRKYYVEITGNPKKEEKYFKYISSIYKELIGKPGKIRISGRGLRIRVYSKKLVEFLIFKLKIHYNRGKSHRVEIPKEILKEKRLFYSCLKGIFDTDGSYFLANKGYRKDYPCIEISTCSIKLANQIREELSKKFRIKFRIETKKTYSLGKKYILSLNGEEETKKWFNLIGSSNNNKLKKYKDFLITKDLKTN